VKSLHTYVVHIDYYFYTFGDPWRQAAALRFRPVRQSVRVCVRACVPAVALSDRLDVEFSSW